MTRAVDYENPTRDDAQYLRDRPWLPPLDDDSEFAEEDEYTDMTVAELREAATEKGLPTEGKKAELQARLREAAASGA